MVNNKGPNTDPYGTPLITSHPSDCSRIMYNHPLLSYVTKGKALMSQWSLASNYQRVLILAIPQSSVLASRTTFRFSQRRFSLATRDYFSVLIIGLNIPAQEHPELNSIKAGCYFPLRSSQCTWPFHFQRIWRLINGTLRRNKQESRKAALRAA